VSLPPASPAPGDAEVRTGPTGSLLGIRRPVPAAVAYVLPPHPGRAEAAARQAGHSNAACQPRL